MSLTTEGMHPISCCREVSIKMLGYTVLTYCTCIYIIYVCVFSPTVINDIQDVAVCVGESEMFSCVLNTTYSSVKAEDVKWYRLTTSTSTTEMIDKRGGDVTFVTSTNESILTSTVTINNARTFYTGYYWVRTGSLTFCNTFVTVVTSTYVSIELNS